jgi:hypothetical protein
MTSQDPDPTQSTPITPPNQPPPIAASPAIPPPPAVEPAWRPPRSDSGRNAGFVFGVILVIIGLWFFATTTLGLDLPRVDWAALWPLLLIGLGAWILLGAMGRRR